MEEIRTPVIDREIGKKVSQSKKAYTIYRNKQIELVEAQKASEKAEIIAQITREKQILAVKAMKAQNNTVSFIRGINELLIWK
jgi:hypothetical protein